MCTSPGRTQWPPDLVNKQFKNPSWLTILRRFVSSKIGMFALYSRCVYIFIETKKNRHLWGKFLHNRSSQQTRNKKYISWHNLSKLYCLSSMLFKAMLKNWKYSTLRKSLFLSSINFVKLIRFKMTKTSGIHVKNEWSPTRSIRRVRPRAKWCSLLFWLLSCTPMRIHDIGRDKIRNFYSDNENNKI